VVEEINQHPTQSSNHPNADVAALREPKYPKILLLPTISVVKKKWRRETKKGNKNYLGEGKTSRQKQQKQSAEAAAWKAEGIRTSISLLVGNPVVRLAAAAGGLGHAGAHFDPRKPGDGWRRGGIKSEATCTGRSKQSSKPGR